MGHVKNGDGGKSAHGPFVLRVERVRKGAPMMVRVLSHQCLGLFTHFQKGRSGKGRSYLCKGEDCPHPFHKYGFNWKGYCACESWEPDLRLWKPFVLEVTENLELDFRHRLARGQVWQLQTDPQSQSENPPVFGTLIETLDPATLRPPFEILSTLRLMYHDPDVVLDKKNPLPDRVIVEYSSGDAPLPIRQKEDQLKAKELQEKRKTQEHLLAMYGKLPDDVKKNPVLPEHVRLVKMVKLILEERKNSGEMDSGE